MNKTQQKALGVAMRKKLPNGHMPQTIIEIINDKECFYGSPFFICKINIDTLTPTQINKAKKMNIEETLQKLQIPHRMEVSVKYNGVYGSDIQEVINLVDEKGIGNFIQSHFWHAIKKANLDIYRIEANQDEAIEMPILLYDNHEFVGAVMPIKINDTNFKKLS